MTTLTPSVPSASLSTPALLLDEPDDAVTQVIVHPLVLLHVLDHHSRRQEAPGRVIGTLLGRRDGRTVEVTNCFAVPHAERGDEVAIGKDFNKQMLALHLRANQKEVVVGWYASASTNTSGAEPSSSSSSPTELIADTSSLIHEFYAEETEEGDPVHLVVDTRLIEDAIALRAYKSTPVTVQGEPLANLFHELKLTMQGTEPETICLNEMAENGAYSSPDVSDDSHDEDAPKSNGSSKEPLQISMERLYGLLETMLSYVDSVVDGNIQPDAEVGREIADTLAVVPKIRPEVFDRLFNDSLQDMLMVTYLSNLTRTQLTIADKLNASLGV